MSNRETRRTQKERSIKRLQKSRGYILLSWDGEKMPVFMYDVTPCTDQGDLRHLLMQGVAEKVEKMCKNAEGQLARHVHEIEQTIKVQELKDKRSAELKAEIQLPGSAS
jgi:predicted nucleic acid-binding Zn ribbon protein